jgi:hypothetical protein
MHQAELLPHRFSHPSWYHQKEDLKMVTLLGKRISRARKSISFWGRGLTHLFTLWFLHKCSFYPDFFFSFSSSILSSPENLNFRKPKAHMLKCI